MRRSLVGLACFVVAFWLSNPASAKPAADEASPDWIEGAVLPMGDPALEALGTLWADIILNFHSGQYSEMLVNLDKLQKKQPDTGIENLPTISASLAFIAKDLLRNTPSESTTALKVLDTAASLSPDLPDFELDRADITWSLDKGKVGEYVSHYFQGIRASISYLPARHGFVLGTVAVLWLAGLVVMLLFSLILLVRHVPLFGHDLSHLIPMQMAQWQRTALGLFVLMIPFLADLGLILMFLFWWFLLWLYASRNERVLIGLLLVFVAAWPLMNRAVLSSLSFPGSLEETAYKCALGECGPGPRAELSKSLERGGASVAVAYSLAQAKVRDLHDSSAPSNPTYKWIAQQLDAAPRQYRPLFLVSLGNVEFMSGVRRKLRSMSNPDAGLDQFQSALRLYDEALAIHPQMVEALYNKSKLMLVMGENAASRNLQMEASEFEALLVAEHEEQSRYAKDQNLRDFNINRELMMPAVPSRFSGALTKGADETLAVAHRLFLGPMTNRTLWPVGGGVAIALALLWFLRRFLKPSSRCVKCGAIHCARCLPEFAGTGLCKQCIYYKLRSSFVDPKETWLREKRIDAQQHKRTRLEVFATFVLPGTGHFLRGRPLRGFLFLGGIVVALAAIFLFPVVSSLVSYSLATSMQSSILGASFWSVLAFVVYFLALVDIYSWR